MFELENKVAIITGASRGIGRGIASTFAKAGANVVCVSRNQADIDSVAQSLDSFRGSAVGMACDVSDFESFSGLVMSVVEKYDKVDILVNNAGITRDGLIFRLKDQDWDQVLDINLKGAFNGIKSVARQMMKQRSGRIINISSVVGLTGNAGQTNYSASKAGLSGLTKSAARELAARNITVNSIAPGYIDTDMTAGLSDELKENLNKQIPLGQIGSVDNIAYTALFLASDEAKYITGQTITVDGGMVM